MFVRRRQRGIYSAGVSFVLASKNKILRTIVSASEKPHGMAMDFLCQPK